MHFMLAIVLHFYYFLCNPRQFPFSTAISCTNLPHDISIEPYTDHENSVVIMQTEPGKKYLPWNLSSLTMMVEKIGSASRY